MANTARVYGLNKIPEDKTRCIADVLESSGWFCHQCYRKRGHGTDGLYCKQHDPKRVTAKRNEKSNKFNEEQDRKEQEFKRIQVALKLCKGIPTDELNQYILIRKVS